MQYCSLQHRTLLLSPVTSTAGCCFCFGSIPSFFLELFLHCTVEVRNRFKGLDLIDRVPEELWTEVHDIVQETGIKKIPMKKKCKKAKWLSEEALQIAVKRREAKSKGEKERYKHLNAEFQRIARRDKKAFLRDQCKKKNRGKQQNGKDWRSLQEIPREHFMQRWAR